MPKKAAKQESPLGRPSWKGQLSLGLVTFTVEAFNALNRGQSDIHFHQLHAKCHSRIHYEKVCPIHGKVTNDEIVSGYEYSKGKYVEFDPEELEKMRTDRERGIQVDAFVSPEAIDPIYYDGRMYYLLPAGATSREAFEVVVAAMVREERYGVGRIVMSGKEQIVLLRPKEGLLQMAMLNYAAEIRSAEFTPTKPKKAAERTRQIQFAQSLIQQWTDGKFDFTQYQDEYRESVEKLINAKVKRHKIAVPKAKPEESKTLNLMEALQKSINQSSRPKKPKSKGTRSTSA